MGSWLLLLVAVGAEVFGATALKLSDGFSHWGWVAGLAAGYGFAFYAFSVVVKTIPLGVAYTAWAGLGALGTFIVGRCVFGEATSLVGWLGAALVVGGVVLMSTGH